MLPTANVAGSDGAVDVVLHHPRWQGPLPARWLRALGTLLRVTAGGGDPLLGAGALLDVDDGLPWAATVTTTGAAGASRRTLLVTGAGGGAGVAWCRTPHGVVASPDVVDVLSRTADRALDVDVLARTAGLDPDPVRTVWHDVRLLARGMVLEVDGEGSVVGERPWFVLPAQPRRPRRADVDEELARLRHELDVGTASMLAGDDGPLGMLCSSGLDSALVATSLAPLAGRRGRRVTAWTAVPAAGAALPTLEGWVPHEIEGARRIAADVGGLDVVAVPDDARPPWIDDIDGLVTLGWTPVPNPGNLPWLRAAGDLARAGGVRTLLTGAGGNLLLSASRPDVGAALLRALRLGAAARAVRSRMGTRDLGLPQAVRTTLLGPAVRSVGLRVPVPTAATAFVHHDPYRHGRPHVSERHALLAAARATYPYELLHSGVGPGVVAGDPTMHPRLVKALAALPDEVWAMTDPSRGVARALLAGRVDDTVRGATVRGLQAAAQWSWTRPRRDAYGDVIASASASPPLRRLVDLAALRRFLAQWPASDAPPDVATLQAFDRTVAALAFGLRAPVLAARLRPAPA